MIQFLTHGAFYGAFFAIGSISATSEPLNIFLLPISEGEKNTAFPDPGFVSQGEVQKDGVQMDLICRFLVFF